MDIRNNPSFKGYPLGDTRIEERGDFGKRQTRALG